MPRRSRKAVALLLALLLAALPLQGLLAAVTAPAPMPQMLMEAVNGQAGATMQDAAMQCQDCDQHHCCDQGACDLQHCLSCVAPAILGESLGFHLSLNTPRALLEQSLPEQRHTSLYRPPRA